MMNLSVIVAFAVAIAFSQALHGQSGNGSISDSAKVYLNKAISIIENRAYYRDRVVWSEIKDSCNALARNASTPRETYDAIRYALRSLNDHHSSLVGPVSMKRLANLTVEQNPKPIVRLSTEGIGCIFMPGFSGLNDAQLLLYVSRLCAQLDSVARTGVRGWVLDLRKNTGGNMWPMLASLRWFLPSDSLGAFVGLKGGKVWWDRGFGLSLRPPPMDSTLASTFTQLPMAVLQGDTTASSGEAVLVAAKGRPHTRTFGRPTSGLSSSNSMFWLSDSAVIFLTTQVFADRFGTIYGRPIVPDVQIAPEEKSEDPALAQAISWILRYRR
jgi:C-terminal processing protease CtpA/Prc